MFTLRRWWDRHRLQVILITLAIGSALFIRQTNARFIFEAYQLLSRPFQAAPPQDVLVENARFQELQQRLVELENQNQRLRDLAGYLSTNSQPGISAPVVGRSADHWWQQIILARGTSSGIQAGYVVTAPGGVVGRVTEVTRNSSRVLLLSDPSSRVGVTISRSRFMGYLRGQGTNQAVMEFFDKVPDVRRGDVVVTSALSQLFPAGLPIGRVESVNLGKSPAPEAIIELSAPISLLEWAVVQPHQPATQNLQAPRKKSGSGL